MKTSSQDEPVHSFVSVSPSIVEDCITWHVPVVKHVPTNSAF